MTGDRHGPVGPDRGCGRNSWSRGGTVIDEIALHGTESLGTQEQSANSLTGLGNSIHYFIGRDHCLAYAIIPEDLQGELDATAVAESSDAPGFGFVWSISSRRYSEQTAAQQL